MMMIKIHILKIYFFLYNHIKLSMLYEKNKSKIKIANIITNTAEKDSNTDIIPKTSIKLIFLHIL